MRWKRSSRCSAWCRCNCWRTTRRSRAGATSISRETWPRASRSSDASACERMQFTSVAKPEYFYQPLQLFRRLRAEFIPCNTPVRLRLPGGAEFVAPGSDRIAQAVLHLGVFDLVVTEALW